MAAIPAVNLKNSLNTLTDVSDVWEPIGIGLGVANHVIMSTKHDVSLTDITRLSRVLQAWIDNDEDVTWDKMIEVLESPAVNKIAKAKEIRKLIGQDIPDVTTTESTDVQSMEQSDGHQQPMQQSSGGAKVVPDPPPTEPTDYPPIGEIKSTPPILYNDAAGDLAVNDANVILVTSNDVEFRAVMGQAKPLGGEGSDHTIISLEEDLTPFYLAKYGLNKVAIIQTDQGARETRKVLDKVRRKLPAQYVIAVGFCYGLREKKVKLGDVIVSTSIVDLSKQKAQDGGLIFHQSQNKAGKSLYNVFKTKAGFGHFGGNKVITGDIVSENIVVADQKHKDQILKQIPFALGGEMEGAGIMESAEENDFEWIVIKAVADLGDGNKEAYRKWQPSASVAAAKYVQHHLNRHDLKRQPPVVQPVQQPPVVQLVQQLPAVQPVQQPPVVQQILQPSSGHQSSSGAQSLAKNLIKRVSDILMKVLKEKEEELRNVYHDAAPSIAHHMGQAGIIKPADVQAPTYEAIIKGFELGLPLTSSIENHCNTFLQALANPGGNCKKAAKNLKNTWSEEVKKELVNFNLLDLS